MALLKEALEAPHLTYLLSPFTDLVLQLLGIGPFWILYLGTVLALLGLIFHASDKTMILGAVAGMLRTFIDKQGPVRVTISPSLARRVGLVLLLAGVVLAAAGTDAIAAAPATLINYGGGGPSLLHCSDPVNVPCWLPGSSGTGCPTVTPSPCWTQVQPTGTSPGLTDCNLVPPSGATCSVTVNFSPVYSVKPNVDWWLNSTSPAAITRAQTATISVPGLFTFLTSGNGTNNGSGWTWTNMPTTDSPIELFGNTTDRLLIPGGLSTLAGRLCVNIFNLSLNATATIGIQSSNDQLSWTDLGDSFFRVLIGSNGLGTGLQCDQSAGEAVALSGKYVRIVGRDGGGIGDRPTFGAIFIEGIFSQTISVPITLTPMISVTSETTSHVTFKVQTSIGVASTTTVNINWWAGIVG